MRCVQNVMPTRPKMAVKGSGGRKERHGFKYMEAKFGRRDFEVWKVLIVVVMIEVK